MPPEEFWEGMDLRGVVALTDAWEAEQKRIDLRFGLVASLLEAPYLKKGRTGTDPADWFKKQVRGPAPSVASIAEQLGLTKTPKIEVPSMIGGRGQRADDR